METLFTWAAIVGGVVLTIQTALTLLGVGLDELDLDPGIDLDAATATHEHFLGALTLRAVIAFATFFGLAGLASRSADLSLASSLVIAIGAGVAAVFAVGQMMAALAKLQSSGNRDMRRAIGCAAHVYLRIPARGEGEGRVHVTVQGRRIEARAIALHDAIPTGADVTVREVAPDGALVVEPRQSEPGS